MGMYTRVVFGVMVTDDLGYFERLSASKTPAALGFFRALGAHHKNPHVVSFDTVDDPVHVVGVEVGYGSGGHCAVPLETIARPAQEWTDRYEACLKALPANVQADLAAAGLVVPKFHVLAGPN